MQSIQVKSASNFLRLCKRIDLQCALFHQNFRKATGETFYDVLGVSKDAKEKEIRKAFIEKSKKFHPDANPNDKSLHEKFVKINDAYKVLSDASSRKIYDDNLKQGFHMGANEVPTTQNWNPDHPQYYYHPKFYKDPRMRKEAAKAWTQNCGNYFDEYMRDDYRDPNDIPPEEYKPNRVSMILMGSVFLTLVYYAYLLTMRKPTPQNKEEMRQKAKGYNEALIDDGSGRQVKVKYFSRPPQKGIKVSHERGTPIDESIDDGKLATKL